MVEFDLLMLMNWWWSERYDLNQERAVPVMWREDSKQIRRMEWLMVSKAALRSRRIRMLREGSSEESRRSFETFILPMLLFTFMIVLTYLKLEMKFKN